MAVQEELRPLVDLVGPGPTAPATVAGLDVAYAQSGDLLAAAVTVLDARTLAVVDSAVSVGRPAFGYVPGLFAFRELPALLAALDRLSTRPDLLVCDGHGLAHPRRFGLACHLGVVTGLPAIGVGKTPLVGQWDPPPAERGAWSPLRDGDLHLAALDAVAVWEHVLYEVRRDVDALAQAEDRTLTARERAITNGIRLREQRLFWQALQSTYEEQS
ncbi:endonuclease V [Micromonospora sp. NPDC005173]|uniref:endonuclease V n=1 Tax=Micromonospora sp. NPDC005173 TaxID=3157165 RepID=UPI0033AC6EB7